MTKEEFVSSLKKSHSAPFLFIGSGFTRHTTWEPQIGKVCYRDLLQNIINQYYSTEGTDNLPSIASAIAKDINTDFWKLPDDDAFKIENQDKAINQSSIFKIKIAQYLKELSLKDFPKQYLEELDLLAKINIDGIITTNWDDTAERIFPKFTRYVGQQELFFAPTFGMSEIYKIHGCISRPESLVLTEEDYNDFNNRNTYLAAKLITIFVEHPIIFLGYSIADNNIQAILRSVVSCFQKDNLQRLQHNLIFVEWNPNEKADFKIDSYGITLEQGTILPVTRINTHDFKPVYECLSYFERSIPANLLREYKKQFYNIVVSQNPEKTLYALPDTKIDGNPDIQVVYGFGAISKFQSAVGYTGIKAINLFKDVIEDTYKTMMLCKLSHKPSQNLVGQVRKHSSLFTNISDVVQNPGARYKASVKTVVRITLKKAQGEGFSFQDIAEGMYQYGLSATDNLDVNYRTGGFDITASFWAGSYGHSKSFQDNTLTYYAGQDQPCS